MAPGSTFCEIWSQITFEIANWSNFNGPVGPLDKGLIKRDICMGGQVSIQYDQILWVWEPHDKEQKCGYPDFEGSWSHIVVTSGSGSK